jgi:hypothetical protein
MWNYENVEIKFEMMRDLRYNARRIGANQRRGVPHLHISTFSNFQIKIMI